MKFFRPIFIPRVLVVALLIAVSLHNAEIQNRGWRIIAANRNNIDAGVEAKGMTEALALSFDETKRLWSVRNDPSRYFSVKQTLPKLAGWLTVTLEAKNLQLNLATPRAHLKIAI